MTAACQGGTSSPKPGAGTTAVVGGGIITGGLLALSPWLFPVAALIDGFLYDTAQNCPNDPPAMPTFDVTDAAFLALGMDAPNARSTLTKIDNLLRIYAWNLYCQCDAVATPPLPTPAPNPTGTATGTGGVQPAPCFTGSADYLPDVYNPASGVPRPDITSALMPTDGRISQYTGATPPRTIHGLPTGVTSVYFQSYQANTTLCGGSSGSAMSTLDFYDVNSQPVAGGGQFSGTQYPAPNTSGSYAIPSNASFAHVSMGYTSPTCGVSQGNCQTKTQVYCGGARPTGLESCCPPDPAISLALNNILNLVEKIQAELGAGNVALVDGTRHAGLTGGGSLTFVGVARAIRVEIRNLPPGWPAIAQVPPYLISAGFITPNAEGVPMRGQRLIYQSQTFSLAAIATGASWQLPPQLTIDLVELVEP